MTMISQDNYTLKPVILPVPDRVRGWAPRERVVFLSRHAREALRRSAEKSGVALGELKKDAEGVPLPSNGHYWSISHKSKYVAGVVSPEPVGIDLEEIRPVHKGLHGRVAGNDEWRLAAGAAGSERMFFRYWTAKEAVMKAEGTGIKDLSRIKIHRLIDETRLTAVMGDRYWEIVHTFFSSHLAALTVNAACADWTIDGGSGAEATTEEAIRREQTP